MLNAEFFEEIRRRDENEVMNHFGSRVGKQLLKQGFLEEKFMNVLVEDGIKMTPLTDEFITEDARNTALDLK